MDPDVKALYELMIEGQRQTDRIAGNLATVVEIRANKTDAALDKMVETVTHLAATVDRYVQAADARMRRIE
jgi:hypothetical protein